MTKRNQYFLTMNEQILMNTLDFDNHPLSDFQVIRLSGNQTFISQIYRAVGHLGENLIFSVLWDLKLYATLITKPTS